MKEIPTPPIAENIEEFLLTEYDRLFEHQKIVLETYHHRFDIYLAIATAAFVGLLSLHRVDDYSMRGTLEVVVLIILLVVGVVIFTSLATASTWQVHLERAMRLIQKHFVEGSARANNYLYFNRVQPGIPGTGFMALLTRGMTSGGPKTLLVIGNSAVVSALFLKQFFGWRLFTPMGPNTSSLTVLGVFLFTALLHVIAARVIYKISGF